MSASLFLSVVNSLLHIAKSLAEVAEVRSGFALRRPIGEYPAGGVPLIQMQDVTPFGLTESSDLRTISPDAFRSDQVLNGGEVLFRSRAPFCAAIVPLEAQGSIAAAPIYVIESDSKVLDSGFLCWYLNNPRTGRWIAQMASGSSIPFVGVSALGGIPIPLPPLDTQRTIASAWSDMLDHKRLTNQLIEQQEKLLRATLDGLCTGRIRRKGP